MLKSQLPTWISSLRLRLLSLFIAFVVLTTSRTDALVVVVVVPSSPPSSSSMISTQPRRHRRNNHLIPRIPPLTMAMTATPDDDDDDETTATTAPRLPRTAQRLLRDLDAWDIRYAPTATRHDLERLWKRQRRRRRYHDEDSSSTSSSSRSTEQGEDPDNDDYVVNASREMPSESQADATGSAELSSSSSGDAPRDATDATHTPDTTTGGHPRVEEEEEEAQLPSNVLVDEDPIMTPPASNLDTTTTTTTRPSSSSSSSSSSSQRSTEQHASAITGDASERQPSSLIELLERLDARGIRYPPRATRAQLLEALDDGGDDNYNNNNDDDTSMSQSLPPPQPSNNNNGNTMAPHMQITANTNTTMDTHDTASSNRNERDPTEEILRRQRRRRARRQLERSAYHRDFRANALRKNLHIPEVAVPAETTTRYVTQKARRISRRARDWWTVDADGIRNVRYAYVRQDERRPVRRPTTTTSTSDDEDDVIVEVRAEPVPRNPKRDGRDAIDDDDPSTATWKTATTTATTAKPRTRPPPPRHRPLANTTPRKTPHGPSPGRRRKQRPFDQQRSSDASPTRSAANSRLWTTATDRRRDPGVGTLALRRSSDPFPPPPPPPPQDATSPSSSPSSSASPPNEGSRRRIYSPYADPAMTMNEEGYRDALDRFGEFLADTADRVMWGKYDDDDVGVGARPSTPSPAPEPRSTRPPSTTARTHSRHWKDRMEERLDYMLGIHPSGGKYYDSWMKQHDKDEAARRDEEGGGGTDAFAFARGRSSRHNDNNNNRHRGRHHHADRPLWEQEGTLWTLLFGVSGPGKKLPFRDAVDGEPGQLLGVVKTLFRTVLVGTGYACRWASVRGAVPQPVIVLAVSTAALTVRKHRLRAVVLVLLGLRTLGELIHGYVWGEDGWEYHDDDDDDDDERVNGGD